MIELYLIGSENEQPIQIELENGGLVTDLLYQIIDSDNITKQLDNVTKTIKIVGNKHNNNVLGSLFNLNRVSTSTGKLGANNSLKKQVEALVYEDGNLITRGNFRIEKVTVKNGVNYYDGIITGFRASFFAQLKDSMLKDLDFSNLNHVYNVGNIENSTTNTSGYIYPLIDYGHGIVEEVNNAGAISTWTKKNLKPAVFLKEYFNKIFNSRNYKVTFEGEIGNIVDKLIIPSTKEKLKNDIMYHFIHTSNTQTVFGVERTSTDSDPYTPVYQSFPSYTDNNIFNWTVRDFFVAKKDVEMDFEAVVDIQDATNWDVPSNLTTAQKNAVNVKYNANVILYREGLDGRTDLTEIGRGYTRITKFMTGENPIIKVAIPKTRITLTEGERLRLRLLVNNIDISEVPSSNNHSGGGGRNEGYKNVKGKSLISSVTFGNNTYKNTNIEIADGDMVEFNKFLIPNIKQVDLVKEIMGMFNLICYSKIENSKHLMFTTYNEYYKKENADLIVSNALDWSSKVDVSNYTLSPLSTLSKKYTWTYSKGEDWLNEAYEKKYKEVYGTKKIDTGNQYKEDETTLTSIFTPTIIPRMYTNVIYPLMLKYSSENLKEVYETEFRLLFVKNSRVLSTPLKLIRRLKYKDNVPSTYETGQTITKIVEVTTVYEGVGLIFDLNYGVPFEIYESVSGIKKNLYDIFFEKMITKNNHDDTIMLDINVYLNSNDVSNLDLSRPIYIDLPTGSNYYKVISLDYKVSQTIPSRLILQKIIL
ncbi:MULTISPECIES: hypothetical protein [Sphingobacterium]|uniref:hypothetical protein n=1 Tax=Sphingobacterium TaxID=28453 RepID=UPI0013D9AE83|nr:MULTISPECIES: hypothetical protein [unclassified Sphingobacterium]